MNRMFKIGVAALALAAVAPAFANDDAAAEREAVGWTPVAIGIATPVQLPWGLNRWDVYGLDLNVLYSDAPRVYGLDIGGLAAVVRDDMMGLQISGLFNFNLKDVYGMRVTLGLNLSRGNTYGWDTGLIAFRDSCYGVDIEFLGAAQREMVGLQIGGLANVSSVGSCGLTIAGLTNIAKSARGCQIAMAFNMTEELRGCQIGLVNYTEICPNGFQIGLVNIVMQNKLKVLPIINGYY